MRNHNPNFVTFVKSFFAHTLDSVGKNAERVTIIEENAV